MDDDPIPISLVANYKLIVMAVLRMPTHFKR